MLLNNFFFIENINSGNGYIHASIQLNKNHPIFAGHFPGLPVVPGVCMIQIVKEILESHEKTKILIEECSNIKFLAVLNPELNELVDLTINLEEKNQEATRVDASILAGPVTFFKLKATYKTL